MGRGTGEGITVLHVDDDPDVASAVATCLRGEGMTVRTEARVADGLDALAAADDGIDCVVSGHDLPDADGLAFLDAVRERDPDRPFVLFTGAGSEALAAEAVERGVTSYLREGSGTEQYARLANRIRTHVERYRAKRRATRRERIGDVVREVNRRLVLAESREAVERAVCETLAGADPYPLVWVGRATADGGVDVAASAGIDFDFDADRHRVTAQADDAHREGPVGRALRTREAQVVEDVTTLALRERRDLAAEYGVESLAVLPLLHDGDCFGVLDLHASEPGAFDAVEIEALSELADTVARAIRAAETRERRADRTRRIRRFQASVDELVRTETRAESAAVAVDVAREVLDLPLSGVHLREDDALVPVAVTDAVREHFEEPPRYERGGDGPADLVWGAYESGEQVVVENARTLADGSLDRSPAESGIVRPLGEHGVFVTSALEPDAFDETDRALAEVLAATLTATLDRADRIERLRDRERELARQNERLEEFAGVVSHDLRNPLNVARGRIQLAIESERGVDRHLSIVADALDRIDAIVEDTLTLASQGASVAVPEPVAAGDLVERCWGMVETGDAALEVVDGFRLRADPERLRHLFENLFRNCAEHGAAGGGSEPDDAERGAAGGRSRADDPERSPSGPAVRVRIGTLDDGDGFYVEDDGPGIPEADRDRIFEPGWTTAADGTGFGLAIVSDVVDAHGWRIAATESEGGGARFEIGGVDSLTPAD
jgi:signal transduction histidine kinase